MRQGGHADTKTSVQLSRMFQRPRKENNQRLQSEASMQGLNDAEDTPRGGNNNPRMNNYIINSVNRDPVKMADR